jgi:hypothetical protein
MVSTLKWNAAESSWLEQADGFFEATALGLAHCGRAAPVPEA